MNEVFGYAVWFAQICAGLAMLNATIRLFIGPAAQDRILALDSVYTNGMLMLLLLGVRSRSPIFRHRVADRAVRLRRISIARQVSAARRGCRTMTAETLPLWVTIPGTVLLVVAGIATLIGSFGLLRLRDFFSRMHGPSMTNTVGVGATLVASMLVSSALAGQPILHELLITLFVSMSAPITAITLLQAALYRNKARHSRDVTPDGSSA